MSIRTPSPRRMTRQGTRTLKAAYALAARDVKNMDPAVLAAVGRAKLNGNDLKYLAHANVSALYGPDEQRFAQQLNAQAAAQIQATTPAAQHTRNPFKKLANWNQNRQDIRAGRQALEAAYGQAKSEVKRIDPNVRQAIGHSRVTKQDLKMLSHSQMSGALRAGIEQAAQHHYAQARASAAAVAAQPQVVRQSAGQRAANVVNTASRWGKAVADGSRSMMDGAKAKAEKFAADYSERRQNPTGRSARPAAEAGAPGREAAAPTVELPVAGPEAAPAAAQEGPNLADTRAQEAKEFHAGLNNTMPMPAQEAGPVFNGPVNDVQLATGNSGSVTQNKVGTPGKGGPPAPGADPAMASASGAVATKPTTQQATSSPQSETSSHNKHRKPESHER